ncbi:MAG: pyruvate kinase [Deltaproteobacteria bacterium]|nr:pyruvate kinase [Deltaproteobacteria bacterium]
MQRHQGPRARQTRIVATIGRCGDTDFPTFLGKLCDAGVDVLRLNMSHADPDYGKEREILAWANQPPTHLQAPRVAVMADLQGPKCRIGKLPCDPLPLSEGSSILLVSEAQTQVAGDLPRVPVPEPVASLLYGGLQEFLADHPGDRPTILFGDGDLSVEVTGLTADGIQARVTAGGNLGSKKGLTVREIDLDLDPFPAKDQRDLQFCLAQGIDFVALSFVRTPADVRRARAFVTQHLPAGQTAPGLIAKIETLAAVRDIEAILAASDGIMVARGDLGLQLGFEEVPAVQKQWVLAARRHGKPCIVATQMLESMIALPLPTRAEATDVFNAILDGGDAVMLSGETSVGSRPLRVVETMDQIARKAETYRQQERRRRGPTPLPPPQELAYIDRINMGFAQTAAQFAESLPAFAIACFTRTGRTPERVSRYRPGVPIVTFCSDPRATRKCLLFWGLHPVHIDELPVQQDRLGQVGRLGFKVLRERYGMQPGDALVVTAGVDWPRGGTNALQVLIEDHGRAQQAMEEADSESR